MIWLNTFALQSAHSLVGAAFQEAKASSQTEKQCCLVEKRQLTLGVHLTATQGDC
jgi:hypothetical protein